MNGEQNVLTIARSSAAFTLLVLLGSAILAAQEPQVTGGGQTPLQPLPGQTLSALPLPEAGAGTATEVTIRWSIPAAPPLAPPPGGGTVPPADSRFDVVARRPVESLFVRERDPQVAPDEIVVIAVGADGAPIGWQHIKDPRIVRAESPGADGVLAGQTLHRALTELVVMVPDGVPATALRLYQPLWTGQTFTLSPLGAVPLNP